MFLQRGRNALLHVSKVAVIYSHKIKKYLKRLLFLKPLYFLTNALICYKLKK